MQTIKQSNNQIVPPRRPRPTLFFDDVESDEHEPYALGNGPMPLEQITERGTGDNGGGRCSGKLCFGAGDTLPPTTAVERADKGTSEALDFALEGLALHKAGFTFKKAALQVRSVRRVNPLFGLDLLLDNDQTT
jgi:hypothetical protein